jgi:hypothetical protein
MKVAHTLSVVAGEVPNDGQTAEGIRNVINKHFIVDEVDYPQSKDIKVTRENSIWTLEANYEDQAPLFMDIAILVTFDKTVRLKGE